MSVLEPTAWIVEVDVVDLDRQPHRRAETLICHSYDGTPRGAGQWAADVLDTCEVYVRSARRAYGQIVEAREVGRLDDLPPRAIAVSR